MFNSDETSAGRIWIITEADRSGGVLMSCEEPRLPPGYQLDRSDPDVLVMRAIELFGTEVAPAVRKELSGSSRSRRE